MEATKKAVDLIKKWEGFFPKPYLDPVGVITIGYGVIKYPNGKRVTMSDPVITEPQASEMLLQLLNKTYVPELNNLLKVSINQNQFDALTSFIYNLGGTNLGGSTLLRKINKNPNDPSIADEFAKWNKAGGKVLSGLTKRRADEAKLYFEPVADSATKFTTTDVNLRMGPGTDYKVAKVLKKGIEVNVLSVKDNWSEVFICSDKSRGWVSSQYLK